MKYKFVVHPNVITKITGLYLLSQHQNENVGGINVFGKLSAACNWKTMKLPDATTKICKFIVFSFRFNYF